MTDTTLEAAWQDIVSRYPGSSCAQSADCMVLVCPGDQLVTALHELRDAPVFAFKQLVDVCGVDFLHYGLDEWQTVAATSAGFSRASKPLNTNHVAQQAVSPRFMVVYHLLSHTCNQRLRVKVYVDEAQSVPSVVPLWPSANWFEREVFDLYGIAFDGHPDMRRILTDYGFEGHPFRKDFPLEGYVEMHYDGKAGTCVYGPVSIDPKVTVPKVIRKHDHRYQTES